MTCCEDRIRIEADVVASSFSSLVARFLCVLLGLLTPGMSTLWRICFVGLWMGYLMNLAT